MATRLPTAPEPRYGKTIKDASDFFQLASEHANIGTYFKMIRGKESVRC
jgi:hypothetical protein